jgi:hypothetical protein
VKKLLLLLPIFIALLSCTNENDKQQIDDLSKVAFDFQPILSGLALRTLVAS